MRTWARGRRPRWATLAWLAVAAGLPAGSSAALVQVRGSIPNTDIALLILAAVLIVATSGRSGAVVVAAVSAALSYDYFHTLPYHSLTIANHNDLITTLVLAVLALGIGLVAAQASGSYQDLLLVLAVAALSQAVPGPARLVVDHHGLEACLGVLVFVTALSIPTSTLASLGAKTRRLVGALAVSTVVLPALAWAASRLVATTALRRGVLVVGLAPAEIASVAAVSLAGGDVTVAAAMLVATTLVTVAGAGIALRLLGGAANLDAVGLLTQLALIVGAPMLLGLLVRARLRLLERFEDVLARLSVALVLLLVWLVASEVRVSSAYVGVAGALVVYLAGSAALGWLAGWRAPRPVATALLLSISMRDFAIAAGIAVAAFGAKSSAPLGLYGVLVILWGMLVASRGRSHAAGPAVRWTAPALPVCPVPADAPGGQPGSQLRWVSRPPEGRS